MIAPDEPGVGAASHDVVLRIEGLKTWFDSPDGPLKALDGVNLEVRRGETLGIVGESGSGKTMTAFSIMRLVPPPGRIVEGHIWFEGEDLVTKSQRAMTRIRGREIAFIPQDPMTSLNPVYTVGNQLEESINLGGHVSPEESIRRATDLFQQVRIAEPAVRLRSYPHQMSGGMRQRVVGAIALAGTPKVIIADEPTTSLDATIQLQYLRLLRRIQSETGAAIIFITHDFGIVARVCDQVAVMYAGRVVEQAPIQDLFDHPSHPYTRGLLASVPALDRDVEELHAIPGSPPSLDALPTGCTFAPRCASAFARCETYPPEFVVGPGHQARCWLHEGAPA